MREDPDVILVGEMRDMETIEIALTAAETGHLVMSTLHTLDATETISRIVSVFPPHQQKAIRLQLGAVLKAIISQRLVPRADGKGRVAALEILRATARVRELIEDADRTKEIPDAINKGNITYGMQSFDQALMGLLQSKQITYEEALRQATNPDDFALRVSGISATSDSSWDGFEGAAPQRPSGPGTAAPGAAGRTATQTTIPMASPQHAATAQQAARPQAAAPQAPRAPAPGAAPPAAPRPAPQPQAAKQPGGLELDDDFKIERF